MNGMKHFGCGLVDGYNEKSIKIRKYFNNKYFLIF